MSLARMAQDEELRAYRLVDFIKDAWHIVEPGSKYVHNWHIDAICDHLEAVSRNEIRNLCINIPPRHAKSLLVSVFFPCWEWITRPELRYIYASYGQHLSVRDSLKCRRLILSCWYRTRFGHIFSLTSDQRGKMKFENDHLGYRLATSVGGVGTGEGGDRVVCFPGETQIHVKFGGALSIRTIVEERIPISVLSYNHKKYKYEYKPVIQYFHSKTNKLCIISHSHGTLICTPEHPLYTDSGYKQACHLKYGDKLRSTNNVSDNLMWHFVSHIEILDETIDVYNISVQDNNNYFANDVLVHNCDDPNNVMESESELVREGVNVWWDEAMSTRWVQPERFCRVVVQQRTHSRDLSGHLLEKGTYTHLCLPAEYEGKTIVGSLTWKDPRTENGQLLWPEFISRAQIDQLKADLGPYAAAGQLQQRPAPRDGGIIKEGWIQFYELIINPNNHLLEFPKAEYIIQCWDTAFEEGKNNDFSACTTWALCGGNAYCIDAWQAKLDFPALQKRAVLLANQWHPHAILIEDIGSGKSLIQVLKQETKLPIKAVKVGRDKETNLHAVSTFVENGRIYFPRNMPWVRGFLDDLCMFPRAPHDDLVDTFSMALQELFIEIRPKMNNNMNIIGR